MKSFITALIIAVLLCIASFYYSFKIKDASDMLLSDTERISAALDSGDFSGAAEMTRKLDRSVKRLEPFLAAFGNHEDVTLVEGCLAQLEVYADGRLVADAGIMRPGDGTKTIEADVSGARMIALESVDGGYWLGTPQLLALWQDVRFEGKDGVVAVEEDTSGAETPQFGILTPPDDPEPRLNGTWTYGVRPGKPILHRIAATGKAPLALSVVGALPKGLASWLRFSSILPMTPSREQRVRPGHADADDPGRRHALPDAADGLELLECLRMQGQRQDRSRDGGRVRGEGAGGPRMDVCQHRRRLASL